MLMSRVEAERACPCGVAGRRPWAGHQMPWSVASIVAGLATIALGVVAAVAGRQPWVAPVILAVLVVSVGVATVVAGRHGHRGWCRVRRSAWIGVAALGVPLRMVCSLAV